MLKSQYKYRKKHKIGNLYKICDSGLLKTEKEIWWIDRSFTEIYNKQNESVFKKYIRRLL